MMGLFSRAGFSKRLQVSPGRISQMVQEGHLQPPVSSDSGKGWPEAYVEEVSARRQGRQTSRSVFGLAPVAPRAERVQDVTVQDGDRATFVQLFRSTDGDLIALACALQATTPRPGRFLPTVTSSLFSPRHEPRADELMLAAEMLGTPWHDIAWVWEERGHLARDRFHQLVIVEDDTPAAPSYRVPGRDRTVVMDRLALPALADKLGRRVPVVPFEASTVLAVEEWRQQGRSPDAAVTAASSSEWDAALALSIASTRITQTPTSLRHAIILAGTRAVAAIDWERSGATVDPFLFEEEVDHVEPLMTVRQPDFARFRDRVTSLDLSTRHTQPTDEVRQGAITTLEREIYSKAGPYGETPDPAYAEALRVLQQALFDTTDEMLDRTRRDGAPLAIPAFHVLRDCTTHPHRLWDAYATTLTTAPAHRLSSPEARRLLALMPEQQRDPSLLTVDADDNLVLRRTTTDYDDEPQTHLDIAVPVVPATAVPDRITAFDAILVERNTQNGPLCLVLPGDSNIHLAPFAFDHPGHFTHGYGGAGPTDLTGALAAFTEWAFGKKLTEEGRDALRSIVTTADQHEMLRIDRGQLNKPNHFAYEEEDSWS